MDRSIQEVRDSFSNSRGLNSLFTQFRLAYIYVFLALVNHTLDTFQVNVNDTEFEVNDLGMGQLYNFQVNDNIHTQKS